MLTHNQQVWKQLYELGNNEQCYSLAWFKPHERIFAAYTSAHNPRTIKIYDPHGLLMNFRKMLFYFYS